MSDSTEYVGFLGLTDSNTPTNYNSFHTKQHISQVRTGGPVKVVAVNQDGNGNYTVDVQPLVKQVDGVGNPTSHGTIYGIPVHAVTGKNGSALVVPTVGDKGWAAIGDRDHSSVLASGGEANPGSRRMHDFSDSYYMGGFGSMNTPDNSLVMGSGGVNITSKQATTITAQNAPVSITAPQGVNITGNTSVTGNVTATGGISGSGGNSVPSPTAAQAGASLVATGLNAYQWGYSKEDGMDISGFSPDPTGVNPSDTAFANVVTAALNANCPTILIPSGTYLLTGNVSLGANAIRFKGLGPNSSIITGTSGSFDFLNWNGSSNDGGVEGIKFLGSGMSGGNFISGTSVKRFKIRDCVFGNGINGVFLQDYNNVCVDKCTFTGLTGSYAIKSLGSSSGSANVLDINSTDIGFSTNISSSPDGLLLDGYFATVDIRHLQVVKGNRGLACTNSGALTGAIHIELTALDFQVDSPYAACVLMNPGSAVSRGHCFTDAYFHASQSTHNVDLAANVQSCKFSGGECTGANQAGFNLAGDFPDISEFQIATNGQSGSGTFPGVLIKSTCTGARVVDNLAGAWSGFGTETQSYGVDIESGASNYTVLGNNLRGNVTGDYRDLSNDANSVIGPNVGLSTSLMKMNQGLQIGSNQVLSTRQTGFGTPTGGADQGNWAAGSITLANLAAQVAKIQIALRTHGLIGT